MFIGLLYLAAGFGLLWGAHHSRSLWRRTSKWPTVTGVLGERGVRYVAGGRGPGGSYAATVKYEYVVAGETYTSQKLYLLWEPSYRVEAEARAFADALPAAPEVHYDPEKPEQSFLLRHNPRWSYWLMVGFGSLAVLIGLARLSG